jgi:orotate phosphoribosyltransferase
MTLLPQSNSSLPAIEHAVGAKRGHFLYESGHHGDLWLALEALFIDARRMRSWASALAESAAACRPEFVCGPLTGGAFLAQLLAAELGVGFIFSERVVSEGGPVVYRLPLSLPDSVSGRRVLLADDAINAGSAVRASLVALTAGGAELVGLAALLTLGKAAAHLAQQHGVQLFSLASLSREMWDPTHCPLCQAGLPLDSP